MINCFLNSISTSKLQDKRFMVNITNLITDWECSLTMEEIWLKTHPRDSMDGIHCSTLPLWLLTQLSCARKAVDLVSHTPLVILTISTIPMTIYIQKLAKVLNMLNKTFTSLSINHFSQTLQTSFYLSQWTQPWPLTNVVSQASRTCWSCLYFVQTWPISAVKHLQALPPPPPLPRRAQKSVSHTDRIFSIFRWSTSTTCCSWIWYQ